MDPSIMEEGSCSRDEKDQAQAAGLWIWQGNQCVQSAHERM